MTTYTDLLPPTKSEPHAGFKFFKFDTDHSDAFARAVAEAYSRRTGTAPQVHILHSADGASARGI